MKLLFAIIFRMSCAAFLLLGGYSCTLIGGKGMAIGTYAQETQYLLQILDSISETGFMFGHQDATVYGIGWEGDSCRSDVKSVCGDYPAVCGWEIGRIERGGPVSLDSVSFDVIRREIISNYARGGVNTVSWHADNPLTGGDSWDVSAGKQVVASILPKGEKHADFLKCLDAVAQFFNSLTTSDGKKIPILFRPWHEHTGSWFWWGKEHCTAEQYKELWVMTYNYLQSKGGDNLLYAYAPAGGCSAEEYMQRYPGDEYVDLLGFDYYQLNGAKGNDEFKRVMDETLRYLTELGKSHRKPIAVTETGLETIPVPNWWTDVLYPVLDKYPISYVLVWRNAREKENHYYAPYPGQVSAKDFVDFYNLPNTLFVSDVKLLFKRN